MNQRGKRVSELIHREIGAIIQFEMRDPRVKAITVTSVKLADDLGYAKVYFAFGGDPKDIKEIAKTLNNAQGFFRTKISERIEMKYVPQLKFYFDETMDHIHHMEELFNQIKK